MGGGGVEEIGRADLAFRALATQNKQDLMSAGSNKMITADYEKLLVSSYHLLCRNATLPGPSEPGLLNELARYRQQMCDSIYMKYLV